MGSTLHLLGEVFTVNAHPDGGHLCNNEGGFVKLIPPGVHLLLEVWEPFRNDLREVIRGSFWPLTNLPEVAPLGIVYRLVLFHQVFAQAEFGMVASQLHVFWCCSNLIAVLGFEFVNGIVPVEFLPRGLEVLLH